MHPPAPLKAECWAAIAHACGRSHCCPCASPSLAEPSSAAACCLPCYGHAWPGHHGPPLASPRAPTGADGCVGAHAALPLGPPPSVLAGRGWSRPPPPVHMARRPLATSAHTASARGRVSQPRSWPALQSQSPAAAGHSRSLLVAVLCFPRHVEKKTIASISLSLYVSV
jgi:hypothetical protein